MTHVLKNSTSLVSIQIDFLSILEMRSRDLCDHIKNDESSLPYLKWKGLLRPEDSKYRKCLSAMKQLTDRGQARYRCVKRSCDTSRWIRSTSLFFYHEGSMGKLNCKLFLTGIVELVYCFLHCSKLSIREMREIVVHSSATLMNWNALTPVSSWRGIVEKERSERVWWHNGRFLSECQISTLQGVVNIKYDFTC